MLLGYQCSSSQVQGCSEHPVSFYCIDAVSGGLSRVAVLTSLEVIENWTLRFLKQSISRALLGLQTSLQHKFQSWMVDTGTEASSDVRMSSAGEGYLFEEQGALKRMINIHVYIYAIGTCTQISYSFTDIRSMKVVTRCFDQTSFRKQAYAGIVYFLPFGRRLL